MISGAARERPTTGAPAAATYEAVVVPRYTRHFARLILEELPASVRGSVLDLGCGTGHPTFELLPRLMEGAKLVAIDHDAGLLDLARRKSWSAVGQRVFFKVESAERLSFGDGVFDTVVANLLLDDLEDSRVALREIHRVLAPGGRALLTRSLTGTFEEVLDMLDEIGLRLDLPSLSTNVARLRDQTPEPEGLVEGAHAAGFDTARVVTRELRLSYGNAAELFSDRLLAYLAMDDWRRAASEGTGRDADELLRDAERALDTYFGGRALSLRVHAGLLLAGRAQDS